MPVVASSSTACFKAWARLKACLSCSTSATCAPTVISGFSAVIGS
jgi:hypothetical protein